jgi:hypothetical protein
MKPILLALSFYALPVEDIDLLFDNFLCPILIFLDKCLFNLLNA